jgi:hypothetical protein
MFKAITLCTALITFAMLLSLNAQPLPSPVQPSPVKRTIMQRADVPGTNLETIYASLEIAAGFKAGRHNHPVWSWPTSSRVTSGCSWTASRNASCTRGSL